MGWKPNPLVIAGVGVRLGLAAMAASVPVLARVRFSEPRPGAGKGAENRRAVARLKELALYQQTNFMVEPTAQHGREGSE
jgi:hypothetical protein